jgi:hypothetical protein
MTPMPMSANGDCSLLCCALLSLCCVAPCIYVCCECGRIFCHWLNLTANEEMEAMLRTNTS